MSILLGMQTQLGSLASEAALRQSATRTARYASGDEVYSTEGRVGMLWQPYGSHLRFRLECGPVADTLGNLLSFDGRLDNFREIAEELGVSAEDTSDSRIALAAFARWGVGCFRRFTGDWAMVAWSPEQDAMFLARDHAGTRTLYYREGAKGLEWATHLDTFVAEGEMPKLSESYVAAYLAGQQTRDLTPYTGILAVPPGGVCVVRPGRTTRDQHWLAFGGRELNYRSEEDYDEEFRARFRMSVARRTEESSGVIAELSGGMDSTAIVCMSDRLRRTGKREEALLDTVSYFDDEEAALDERRYFSITEAYRGKAGKHLEMAFSERRFLPHDAARGKYLLPGADSLSILREERLYDCVWSRGYRAVLSGIGGDEMLGGVPDRYPELGNYLIQGAWKFLVKQSLSWCLVDRDPIIQTLVHTLRWTTHSYAGQWVRNLPPWLPRTFSDRASAQWADATLLQRLVHYTPRQIDNERTWWAVMETLPHQFPRILARPEYRYPFLDKDLVDFLLRVPRSVLLRPGRRRAMMRRALIGIVPEEILERKCKAYQVRGPSVAFQRSRDYLERLLTDSLLAEAGFVRTGALREALESVCAGSSLHAPALIRTIALELWLRSRHLGRVPGDVGADPSLAA